MSSYTITDPSGVSPALALSNDRGLTNSVLMDLEAANIANDYSEFKAFVNLDTTHLASALLYTTTLSTAGTGSGNTRAVYNVLRFRSPYAMTLQTISVFANHIGLLDGSNTFTVDFQKSTTTAAAIDESSFSTLASLSVGSAVYGLNNGLTSAIGQNETFRVKITKTNSPVCSLMIAVTFRIEHKE